MLALAIAGTVILILAFFSGVAFVCRDTWGGFLRAFLSTVFTAIIVGALLGFMWLLFWLWSAALS